ncbi:major capsid protein [Paraglaciecola Antarctic GD virus 1]|nr:major capsid protein [Paraglaciecola Antarctic GD virus 1]
MSVTSRKELANKWKPLLESEALPTIVSSGRREITAVILENQEKDLESTGYMSMTDAPRVLGEAMVQGSYSDANAGSDDANTAGVAAGTTDSGVVGVGPAIMGMVRRAIPKLMAFDTVGVQPMTGPTGQIFAMRTVYGSDPKTGQEAFAPGVHPQTQWSGSAANGQGLQTLIQNLTTVTDNSLQSSQALVVGDFYTVLFSEIDGAVPIGKVGTDSDGGGAATDDGEYFVFQSTVNAPSGTYSSVEAAIADGALVRTSTGLLTSVAEAMEAFNGSTGNPFNEMSFRIDKQIIEAKSRQLKAQYSIELAQDLKAVHGLDADSELASILSNEILIEIDREIINFILVQAQIGASGFTGGTTTTGTFDLSDSSDIKGARWAGETYKMLLVQIEKESNEIGRQTGRGAGNFIIASRNVVSALAMVDTGITYGAQGLQSSAMNTDTNTSVYAGMLGTKYKVFIDQYATSDYFVVGYKGQSEMDAGVFYSPYIPLTPLRGADAKNMQPVMAFKTRYGTQVNPFVAMTNKQIMNGMRGIGANQFFRKVMVAGL